MDPQKKLVVPLIAYTQPEASAVRQCVVPCARFAWQVALLVGLLGVAQLALAQTETVTGDVIVAGGSTAALAAAFEAAEQGANTILIEPTDWIGGQLTASGVPPIDEAWHTIQDGQGNVVLNVAKVARDPRNMTPGFRDILAAIGNPGRGWVSRYCYTPDIILDQHFRPWEKRLESKLTILRNTVVKRVLIDGRMITALEVIRRFPRDLSDHGFDVRTSRQLNDWYSPETSRRFNKKTLRIVGRNGRPPVVIEATEWGEVLALSGKEYLQGVDRVDGSLDGNDRCGQSIVFGFVQQLHHEPTKDPAMMASAPRLGLGKYEGQENAWNKIWTYRRLRGSAAQPMPGDLSLQNWGFEPATNNGGNDYPDGYLFPSKRETAKTLGDWRGGVDLQVMRLAELRALAWHHWFKSQASPEIGAERITLALGILGTGHGLCKLPYIRDTRRAIGQDGFILRLKDLVGEPEAKTGTRFPDTIALGAYPVDVHFLANCEYPEHVIEHLDTKPFCIPFRALTHRDFDNLLVAGKTMAQSFMANSATRLQPIEWSSGTAAGVVANWMSGKKKDNSGSLSSNGRTTAANCEEDTDRMVVLSSVHHYGLNASILSSRMGVEKTGTGRRKTVSSFNHSATFWQAGFQYTLR